MRLSAAIRRTITITCRCTNGQLRMIDAGAKALGQTRSQFLLDAARDRAEQALANQFAEKEIQKQEASQ